MLVPAQVLGRKRIRQSRALGVARRPVRRYEAPERVPRAVHLAAELRDEHESIERDAGKRRPEQGEQRQLVARVGQRGEVRAQVAHLLLAPISASAEHIGGDAPLLERALVHREVGGGTHEHPALAGLVWAGPRELVDPAGEQTRLGGPPRGNAAHGGAEELLAGVLVLVAIGEILPARGASIGHQQLDTRLESCLALARGRAFAERLEVLAPDRLEHRVDGLEYLSSAAEVDGDALGPVLRARLLVVLTEHLHVGVAEAVDRLPLVADAKEIVAGELTDELV